MNRARDHGFLSVVSAVPQFVNPIIGSLLSPSRRCHIPTLLCNIVPVRENKNLAGTWYWETATCVAGHRQSDRGCSCEYWELP
jgi:hypothetical protein